MGQKFHAYGTEISCGGNKSASVYHEVTVTLRNCTSLPSLCSPM